MKTQLSEPLPVYKFAKIFAIHAAKGAAELGDATASTIRAFRDAAEAGEDWFIGDKAPFLALDNLTRNFESLRKVKIHPRRRRHLVVE